MSNLKFSAEEKKKVDDFVNQSPNSMYYFDATKRGSKTSELCQEKSRKCILLEMESRHLFEYMQKLGYFCQLPFDPSRTEIECRRIEPVSNFNLKR
ncbi:hypothetical protein BY996DRAFT_6968024 [Phakopsora pachyrhizi]|nr:hypothetical protein BY996DRAFT_6968024 [Phakopsora pachyrhizi]